MQSAECSVQSAGASCGVRCLSGRCWRGRGMCWRHRWVVLAPLRRGAGCPHGARQSHLHGPSLASDGRTCRAAARCGSFTAPIQPSRLRLAVPTVVVEGPRRFRGPGGRRRVRARARPRHGDCGRQRTRAVAPGVRRRTSGVAGPGADRPAPYDRASVRRALLSPRSRNRPHSEAPSGPSTSSSWRARLWSPRRGPGPMTKPRC